MKIFNLDFRTNVTYSQAGISGIPGGSGSLLETLTPDTGGAISPTANNINIFGVHGINTSNVGASTMDVAINNAITLGDLAVIAAGSNALSATTGDINITAGNLKLPNTNGAGSQGEIQFGGNRWVSNFRSGVFVGANSGNTTMGAGATANVGVGNGALAALTTANDNNAFGGASLAACTTGGMNLSAGSFSSTKLTTGQFNTVAGYSAAGNLLTGSYNVILGQDAGLQYTGAESSNICIGIEGVTGDNHVIRIGNYGSTSEKQNKCYIASAFSNYGTFNTFVGEVAGNTSLTIANAVNNTAVGAGALQSLVGSAASKAQSNTAGGFNSLGEVTDGSSNVAYGWGSGADPNNNWGITTGNFNTLIGNEAGNLYKSNESSNVILGFNQGTTGESHVMRLGGGTGTGNGQQNKAYASGINGVTTLTGVNMVVIDGNDQLGVQAIPVKSAFSAALSANTGNDVTGDNTVFSLICDTELFDINNDYNNATGVFTAPATGTYSFFVSIQLANVAASGAIAARSLITVSTGASYVIDQINFLAASTDVFTTNGSVLIQLTAADTVSFSTAAFGGAKVVRVDGGAAPYLTYVSGYRVY